MKTLWNQKIKKCMQYGLLTFFILILLGSCSLPDFLKGGKYGEAYNWYIEEKCPECGKNVYTNYYEHMVIDPSITNAAKINGTLEAYSETAYEEGMKDKDNHFSVNCQVDHSESDVSTDYRETIKEVETLLGKYLYICKENYHYLREEGVSDYFYLNFIFDLETGDVVGLGEMYPGTENEFKEKAASAVTERLWDSGYAIDSDTKEGLYKKVYNLLSFDYGNAYYDEDGITFRFGMDSGLSQEYYELEATVSYEELGMR